MRITSRREVMSRTPAGPIDDPGEPREDLLLVIGQAVDIGRGPARPDDLGNALRREFWSRAAGGENGGRPEWASRSAPSG